MIRYRLKIGVFDYSLLRRIVIEPCETVQSLEFNLVVHVNEKPEPIKMFTSTLTDLVPGMIFISVHYNGQCAREG